MNPLNTAVNKFVIAVIGMVVMYVNTRYNTDWVLDAATINYIAGILTPALVYYIPNKKV